jgi:cell division protein FtsB
VPGYYNSLLEFSKKCQDPDFKNLLIDVDIAKAILGGFVFLYQSHASMGADLGILNADQRDFIWARLRDCEIILERRVIELNNQIDIETVADILERKNQELEEKKKLLSLSKKGNEIAKLKAEIDKLKKEVKDLEKKLKDLREGKKLSQDKKELLDERDRICALLSHMNYILDKKNAVRSPPEKKSLSDLGEYVKNLFIQRNEIADKETLTEDGKVAAKKIASLLEIFRERETIFTELKLEIDKKEFERSLTEILFRIAADILINRGYILKENDLAQSSFRNPTFLMEIFLALLHYNSHTGIERFRQFEVPMEDREFFLNIMLLAFVSTSDSLHATFDPDIFRYLRFDSVDIDKAFEIKKMLVYFIAEIEHTPHLSGTDQLEFFFQKSDYHYPPSKNPPKSIPEMIKWKENKQIGWIFTRVITRILRQLEQNFNRQVYRNLKGDAVVAFGDDKEEPQTFELNTTALNCQILDSFVQRAVPPSLFYSLHCTVDKRDLGLSLRYDKHHCDEYFPSLRSPEKTLLKEVILFIDEARTNGISIERAQELKAFMCQAWSVVLKETKGVASVKDFLNLPFESYGLKFPYFSFAGTRIPVTKDNVDAIIQLRNQNRREEITTMKYEEILCERIINVWLLKALT